MRAPVRCLAQYEAGPWGWDAAEKRSELAHGAARFVLVRDSDGAIQGFAHFRFDVNAEDYVSRAVLYVRELQVAESFRGAGLGTHLMGLLQLVAGRFELDCVMLTVFKSNARALVFYHKLQYAIDEDDPINFDDSHKCYHILSRRCRGVDAETAMPR